MLSDFVLILPKIAATTKQSIALGKMLMNEILSTENKLRVHRIANRRFSANTYVIYSDVSAAAWLVDCGDWDEVESFCAKLSKTVVGVFLTHGHFDHIYGLREMLAVHADVPVYLSAGGVEIVGNAKLNLSRYVGEPFVVDSCRFVELAGGERIPLLGGQHIEVYATPGHSPDSLSFLLLPYLFTGDALIPNIHTVTTLRGGNKSQAEISLGKILNISDDNIVICPGHNAMCQKNEVDIARSTRQ